MLSSGIFSTSFAGFVLPTSRALALCVSTKVLGFASCVPFVCFVGLAAYSTMSTEFYFTFSFFVTSSEIAAPQEVKGGTSVPTSLRTLTSHYATPTGTVAFLPCFFTDFTAPANTFPVTIYPSVHPSPIVAESTSLV